MNSREELKEYGFVDKEINLMLNSYAKRINTIQGIYRIIDINYNNIKHTKDVTLECTKCGKVIHRFVGVKNNWAELIKTCECQKVERDEIRRQERVAKKQARENFLKNKKDYMRSQIGTEIGLFVITDYSDNNLIATCSRCGRVEQWSYNKYRNGDYLYRRCPTCEGKKRLKYTRDYIGRKKNYLTVVDVIFDEKGRKKFLCRCDCGKLTKVEPNNWEYSTVYSCGCKARELLSLAGCRNGQDGVTHLRIYRVLRSMINRCENPNATEYENYGGRGIRVCEEWHDPWTFIDWAYDNGYDETASFGECTIDRIDVNGDYEPSNCRWVSLDVQAKNKRPSSEWKKQKRKMYSYNGKDYNIDELAVIAGVTAPTLTYRINKMGVSVTVAVEMAKATEGRPRKANNENK